ncbi:MAG: molecular chaperone DnaJ [Dehalococcoidia bacterium]
MNSQADLYETLGVTRDAPAADIKRAFRRLAMEYHPDRNKEDGAEQRFKQINAAYEVLSDPEKRARYDRLGLAGVGAGGAQGFDGVQGFGGFGDIFDAFFRGTATRRAGPQRGADLQTRLRISFVEAVFGAEKELTYDRTETCADCRGSGQTKGSQRETCAECKGSGELRRVQQSLFGQFVNVTACSTCRGEGTVVTDPCTTCRGRGIRRRSATRVVKIPAGVDEGAQIRLAGEGDNGLRGGPAGSLFIELDVEPHEQFRRMDDHLVYDLPLNIAQAALGATVQIPTLDGEDVEVELKPGIQHGEVHPLRGRGVPHLRGSGRGDLLVRLHVVTPTKLNAEQRRTLEELSRSLGAPDLPKEQGAGSGFFDRIREAFS